MQSYFASKFCSISKSYFDRMSLTNSWVTSPNSKANTHGVAGTATGGTIMVTYGQSVGIFTNSGNTFSQSLSSSVSTGSTWGSITMSDSGAYVYVTTSGSCPSNMIYSTSSGSTNNWMAAGVASGNWDAVAVSSTGQYIVAVSNNNNPCSYAGMIYGSSNYGASFSAASGIPAEPFTAVAMDSTGYYSYFATSTGLIFTASNYGGTYGMGLNQPTITWNALAASDTGAYVCATGSQVGALYCSSNFGTSWTSAIIASGSPTYTSIAMDSTGQYVAVGTAANGVYLSQNFGANFFISNQATGSIVGITANDAFTQVVAATSSSLYYGTIVSPTHTPTVRPSQSGPTFQPTPAPPITVNGMGVYVGVPIAGGLIFCILWYCFLKFCLAPRAKEQLTSQENVNVALPSNMPTRPLSNALKADAI